MSAQTVSLKQLLAINDDKRANHQPAKKVAKENRLGRMRALADIPY